MGTQYRGSDIDGTYPYPECVAQLTTAEYGGLISAECSISDPLWDRRLSLSSLRLHQPRATA